MSKRLNKARAGVGTVTRDLTPTVTAQMPAINPNNQTPESMAMWANAFFGPGVPRQPMLEEEQPRQFDYMSGINLQIIPRSGFNLIPFWQLRAFADTFEYVRVVIEAFKREIRSLEWDIRPINDKDDKDYSAEIETLREFWRFPDRVMEFDGWLNAILEDMLVLDAVSLWLQMDGNNIAAVEQIDGATVRPLLDPRGRTPFAPTPAYAQVIKGIDWLWMNSEQFLYRPFNTAVNSPYGTSPTEFILTTINTTLRRQMAAMVYWDQTNTPEALVGLPAKWNINDIKDYQAYFDALLTGDTNKLRRIKFFPVDGANIPVHEFRRPDTGAGATVQDEWALKVCCWAFGLSPSEFGLVHGAGLGGKGFMEGAENALYRFGIGPVVQFIQNMISGIVKRQTKSPLCFRFTNIGPTEDRTDEAALMEIQLRNGAIDVNVWRQKLGQEPVKGAKPFMVIGNTPILLDDLFNPEPPPPPQPVPAQLQQPVAVPPAQPADGAVPPADEQALKYALSSWREKCSKRQGEGKPAECDPPVLAKSHIPAALIHSIKTALGKSDINTAFDLVKKKPQHANVTRDKIEAGMQKALTEAFAGLSLPTISSAASAKAVSKGGAFWASFRDALQPVLLEWITKSAHQGIDEVQNDNMFQVSKLAKATAKIDWNLINDKAVDWATAHTDDLLADLELNTQTSMGDTLARWIESGDPMDELVSQFAALIDNPIRAEMIASTETTRAFAEGNTEAWTAQGVEGRRWFTAEDEMVCPICSALADTVAKIDEPFEDGTDNPPAHPRCRCYLQPVEVME